MPKYLLAQRNGGHQQPVLTPGDVDAPRVFCILINGVRAPIQRTQTPPPSTSHHRSRVTRMGAPPLPHGLSLVTGWLPGAECRGIIRSTDSQPAV